MIATTHRMRIADLWALQEIDSAIDSRRGSLDDARASLEQPEEIEASRSASDVTRRALDEARGSQKDLELEADDLRAKIKGVEEKLYGGSVRNPKELSDLQADVDSLKRHLSEIEDRDLEAIGATEAAENAAREAADRLATLEREWQAQRDELGDRIERLTIELAAYDEQRREAAGRISPDVLRVYDHVRRAHQGRGVAKLDRNLCLGCRISLPVSIVNRARAGNALVQCPNCERILYA
jgi:predicted  nucleic acid-binding Zn-ribbon protein